MAGDRKQLSPEAEARRQVAAKNGMKYAKSRRIEAVRLYFAMHPGCTNRECAVALNLSEPYISELIKIVRAEWTKDKRRSNSK